MLRRLGVRGRDVLQPKAYDGRQRTVPIGFADDSKLEMICYRFKCCFGRYLVRDGRAGFGDGMRGRI